MPNGRSVCQIPCALRSNLQIDSLGRHLPLTNLSQSECDIIFLHWVVTERNILPYLSTTERLTCPVLWCGINFDNGESLSRHLKDCPHLSASGYWCPRCHRAESFASNKIPGSDYQSPVQKKPSRLKKLLCKPFSRKRASDPSQDSTMKLNPRSQELHSDYIPEMDGMCLHAELNDYDPGPELEADGGGQQRDTFGSPDTIIMNSAPPEIHEMGGNSMILPELASRGSSLFNPCGAELPTMEREEVDFRADEHRLPNPFPEKVFGQPHRSYISGHTPGNSSPEFSQFKEPLHFLNSKHEDLFLEAIAAWVNVFDKGNISQIDGRNLASGMFDHQGYGPSHTANLADVQTHDPQPNLDHAPRSTPPDYPFSQTQNLANIGIKPTINTINVRAEGQRVRQGHPYPETGPIDSPLSASSSQTTDSNTWSMGTPFTPLTPFSGAGSPTGLLTHYGPSHIPNLAEDQTPCHLLGHAGSRLPFSGLPHPRNPIHIGIRQTMDPLNTINVSAKGQKVRQGHPNPETGPENSALSASSNHTNTDLFSGSAGTFITPLTPFSGSVSPTGLLNISNSPARSSRSPRENGKTCECGKYITDRSNFRRHKKEVHEKARTPCRDGCGRTFTRGENEGRHYEKQHQGGRTVGDTKRREAKPIHTAYASDNFF